MPAPHPRQRLLNGFCLLHRVLVLTYPARFRHEFGDELLITYRNHAAAALREVGLAPALSLLAGTVGDWVRTLASERSDSPPASLFGLAGRNGRLSGYVSEPTYSVALLLASLGVALMLAGWVQWIRHEAAFFSQYCYQDTVLGAGFRRGYVLVERASTTCSSDRRGSRGDRLASPETLRPGRRTFER